MTNGARPRRKRSPKFRLHRAIGEDLETLVEHRKRMFQAIGKHPPSMITSDSRAYRRWARLRLRSRELVGFIARSTAGVALGSGCLWFAPDHPRPGVRALRTPYVMSMFTDPVARGQGVATAIVRSMIVLARRQGYQRIVLHAAPMGVPVYRRLGFEPSPEMRLWLDPALARLQAPRRPSSNPAPRRPIPDEGE